MAEVLWQQLLTQPKLPEYGMSENKFMSGKRFFLPQSLARESMSPVGTFAESLLGWESNKKWLSPPTNGPQKRTDSAASVPVMKRRRVRKWSSHKTQKCLQSTRKESPGSSSPFEAISQTEFLSFDQLSQSSHIYLAGEAGDTCWAPLPTAGMTPWDPFKHPSSRESLYTPPTPGRAKFPPAS